MAGRRARYGAMRAGLRGESDAPPPDSGGVVGDRQILRHLGLVDDRLAGVQDVEIAALDRRLGLDLAAARSRRRLDAPAVLDHLERPRRPLQLRDDRLA